jgi:hypothetical protein
MAEEHNMKNNFAYFSGSQAGVQRRNFLKF